MELNKKNKNFKKKVKPAPVYDEFQKEIANDLLEQAKHFACNINDAANVDDRRNLENQLFQLGSYPLTAEDYPDCALYAVERFIRTDRETHKLVRATTSIVVNSFATGKPLYFINAYLSPKGGRISVTPMGDRGPIGRNTYAININYSDLLLKEDVENDGVDTIDNLVEVDEPELVETHDTDVCSD